MDNILQHANNLLHWINQAKYHNAAGKSVFEKSNDTFTRSMTCNDMYDRFSLIEKPEMWMKFSGALLFGYAIEILIKGLIIKEKRSEFKINIQLNKNEKLSFPWKSHGHNLLGLAHEQSLIIFTDNEKGLLKQLKRIVIWSGRYPVPIVIEPLGEELKSNFEEVYDRLYNKLLDKLIE